MSKWRKGKPIPLVIMAEQIAVGAEPCFEFLELVKAGERIGDLSLMPNVREWLRLYRSHRRMQRCLIGRFRTFGGIVEEGADFAELIFLGSRGIKKMVKWIKRKVEKMSVYERRRFISEVQRKWNQVYNLHLSEIQSEILGKRDLELNEKLREALKEPEIAFFFRAWVPCWLLYGEYAPRMMRRARMGDLDAMEKLLRLDASVVSDPRVGEYLHEARTSGKKATFERLTEALKRGPKSKVTLKKVVYRMAGLISLISDIMKHRLTEREIWELFSAVAHDMGKEETDLYLTESPEAFAKAIQRERGFWMPTIRPDKK